MSTVSERDHLEYVAKLSQDEQDTPFIVKDDDGMVCAGFVINNSDADSVYLVLDTEDHDVVRVWVRVKGRVYENDTNESGDEALAYFTFGRKEN